MDITFWATAVLLSGVGTAFIIPPLLRKHIPPNSMDGMARNRLNAQIFRERLAILEETALSKDEFVHAKSELEKNLVHELDKTSVADGQSRAQWAAAVVAVFIPAMALGGYWLSSADTRVQQQHLAQAQQNAAPTQTMPSVEEMVEKLRKRLETEPDDIEGWQMLARSYAVMERYDAAAKVYAKLLSFEEQNPDVMADYAENLAMAHGEDLRGKPQQLLQQALQLNPDHPKALWLAGMAAMQQNQPDEAARHWQRLLKLMPTDSEDYAFFYNSLEQIGRLPENTAHPAQDKR
jgi:cytochrome c-type biogenesis protein CcmH